MEICGTVERMRAVRAGWKGASVALVPTMGALHRGHLALVEAAHERAERIVASIFVNPTQFGDPADLAAYPREEAADRALLEQAGVDALFLPSVAEMYPPGAETVVETERLAGLYHGAVRPGHFRGVATVVCKLLNIVRPDIALFGEKDYQQLAVIRRMVRDLFIPVEIVGVPTLREADGLAMSSRNRRLGPEDRRAAAVLSRALDRAEALAAEGAPAERLAEAIREVVGAEPRARLCGLDIVDAETFEPVVRTITRRAGIMLSAEVGGVLLLDQREVGPRESAP
ncbi:pantoate--beta-alanine ligase [Rubellimicrobium sp. CFH 75288]|uniref:pantoate--beta-alanine ligase n=1 Tax=Rubellimicrobium sp. CFH 75288 TaxID=2697034 RepID=UPI0014129F9F|nr:pantoate--beta-alanine ligase [Rubellimicrobium sp. CFH 75288]NAZ35954.1 pantoate--beta-alanine ligase [Rubellimicrobium sp. CFH 75288]